MLVLSRKVGERMVIGETIVLTVLEVSGRRIRLGIEAPPGVAIWGGRIACGPTTRCGPFCTPCATGSRWTKSLP